MDRSRTEFEYAPKRSNAGERREKVRRLISVGIPSVGWWEMLSCCNIVMLGSR